MEQGEIDRLQAQFYNVVNYPFQDGCEANSPTAEGIRKCQEICAYSLSASAAVVFSRYGAAASFGGAALGYIAGHYIVGTILRPFVPKP